MPNRAAENVQTKSNMGIWTGVVTLGVGIFVAILPLIGIAGDPENAAAAAWLFIITIPVGGITALVGLIILIVAVARKSVK